MIWPLQLSAPKFRFYESIESESALIWALVTAHNNMRQVEIPKHWRDAPAATPLSLPFFSICSPAGHRHQAPPLVKGAWFWFSARQTLTLLGLLVGCNLLLRWAENVPLNLIKKKKEEKKNFTRVVACDKNFWFLFQNICFPASKYSYNLCYRFVRFHFCDTNSLEVALRCS